MKEQKQSACIRIQGAATHNLKHISLDIPHHQLIVVTGVSGSGKSSLAFEVIAREGQRRYLETYSTFSRQFMGQLGRPSVEHIEGLSPVITVGQKTVGSNARSTVGTMSDLYDGLRLLFARLGHSPDGFPLSRSLFSFNTPQGACPVCKGLGQEEKISVDKLVANAEKTLREGALAPTLPNGYIMYSQVTIDVLNQVCEAHGFNVEIPWRDLTSEQQDVILNGSTRIKVPFGKHSLESRLKWTGITAKPREEGHYKGMLPIMTDILRRDRNANILRYAETMPCSGCNGKRLRPEALATTLQGRSIADWAALDLRELRAGLDEASWPKEAAPIAAPVIARMVRQIKILEKLGLGHLSLDRKASTLSGGESQRIRLVNQVAAAMSNVLYVFDEPSIGMHPRDNQHLLDILRMLVQQGNTVLVVEHDLATIRQADWIVDIGPAAGAAGGKLLYNGPLTEFLKAKLPIASATQAALLASPPNLEASPEALNEAALFYLENCQKHNLKGFDAPFLRGGFNVVTGVSGAGKSSLVQGVLQPAFSAAGADNQTAVGGVKFDRLVTVDQKPIGRTPRSNPATYTGLADHLRDLFAKLPEARAAQFTRSRFSFNTKGGRCETCQGAGRVQVGMHFMGKVDVVCATCEGHRFNAETRAIKFRGKSISEVYEMTVREALAFLADQPRIVPFLETLEQVGLGYLHLGQASSTLSGGEAQRVKLASQLRQPGNGQTLYLLDEPTTGLHAADVRQLVGALRALCAQGHTVVCIEHDVDLIRQADWVLDLGPGSGREGGELLVAGPPAAVAAENRSLTGAALRGEVPSKAESIKVHRPAEIALSGVQTHSLKNIDVQIPHGKMTVITGVSGSGKSSLAFDTVFAEARSLFSESLSTYVRSQLKQSNSAEIETYSGLGPAIAIGRRHLSNSGRSTVGTVSGVYDHLRLLYSRMAQQDGLNYAARHFSFNHQSGACPVCDGLGHQLVCDPEKLVVHPENSVNEGLGGKNKRSQFYMDPHGQYLATLKVVAEELRLDLDTPWKSLDERAQSVILHGTGERKWKVTWHFKNKTRSGVQNLETTWEGFCGYLTDEYRRRHTNKKIEDLEALLMQENCSACDGARLCPEVLQVRVRGKHIGEVVQGTVAECQEWFVQTWENEKETVKAGIWDEIRGGVLDGLRTMEELGLGYLSLDRMARSLSGGEGQRLRLAGALSARLYGVTYVLDEPTIGLHEQDTMSLLDVLKRLVKQGNTLVVVEHDRTVIEAADHVIEMGPGAGKEGGEVLVSGPLRDILAHPASPTGAYLSAPFVIPPKSRQTTKAAFGFRGIRKHNLQGVDIDFDAGGIIAVTGVSGSGKSTLVHEVMWRSVRAQQPINCTSTFGLDQFAKVLVVDQQPLRGNLHSTPATYLGLLEVLRSQFSALPAAKTLGLKKGAFSYHHKDGKCPDCRGVGQQKTALDFLGDVWSRCETCAGGRYRAESLQVTWQGKTIAEALQLSIAEALDWAADTPKLQKLLTPALDVGLGHLHLGQGTATLSGGEAQRLRLAAELARQGSGRQLFLFDEPSTGLHFQDIRRLAQVFDRLADTGHTVLFIEHHPLLIGMANQVIELER